MVQYIVDNKEIKLIDFIYTKHPALSYSAICKALRDKDIKVNGKRINENILLNKNDVVQLYINIENNTRKPYKIVFENDTILIVSKDQGITVNNEKNSLIDIIRSEYKSDYELCHRLDRNTGGLIIISKDKRNTPHVCKLINERNFRKLYTAIVVGDMRRYKENTILKAWLFKDAKKNTVYVYDEERKFTKEILTGIRCISYDPAKNASVVEIDLITGRTHQIRAHLAHLGHPIVGDGKYGDYSYNRQSGYKYQALWASTIISTIKDPSGIMPDEPVIDTPRFK